MPSRIALSNHSLVVVVRTVPKETSEVGSPSAITDLKKTNRTLGARVALSDFRQSVSCHTSASMLGLPYIGLVNLSRTRPKGFTRVNSCGKNGDVTGARILLSLSPLPLIRAPALTTQTVPQSRPSYNVRLTRLRNA